MHILVVRKNSSAKAIDASLLLTTYLTSQSIEFTLVDASDLPDLTPSPALTQQLEAGIDLAVVLGGDGTILRTVHQTQRYAVPILGLNFGRLGFLANDCDKGVVAIVAAALAGDVVTERRSNLKINVVCEGDTDPWIDQEHRTSDQTRSTAYQSNTFSNAALAPLFALNEIALKHGTRGRVIDCSLDVSGTNIADVRGDGLVVASATGSTAYALSAGGPLVAPSVKGLVIVPLAPHTLRSRAIVTAEHDVVCIELAANSGSVEASLFIDGNLTHFNRPIRRVYVRRGDEPTILLRHQHKGFYEHVTRVFF